MESSANAPVELVSDGAALLVLLSVASSSSKLRDHLFREIRSAGFDVELTVDSVQARNRLFNRRFDVVVAEVHPIEGTATEILGHLREQKDSPPVIVIVGKNEIGVAVDYVQDRGAFWHLERPIKNEHLQIALKKALEHARFNAAEPITRTSVISANSGMVGESPQMQRVFTLIGKFARRSVSVLLGGESGTGKELAAAAIHRQSDRVSGPFVAINCAAIPETLIEAELFGHEKGAFTGAVERRPGCFELAHYGTLLLDEIGEMPFNLQARLLRVLENHKVRRLGGKMDIPVDVRVVASTNRPLRKAVDEGKIRLDLFYRLNAFTITLPPLRERLSDLPLLVRSFVDEFNTKHRTAVKTFSASFEDALIHHEWRGNIRELRNSLEFAVVQADPGTELLPEHLPDDFNAA